ncbi:hypothetical protein L3Y34_019325 [Caenorhabditis briggsae]|uniref:Uncharacterized protein n=1 Tax=Caenorhabditis briggsae TaxID=6238 RepID=A0AAE9IVZ5_CAEBR|nr:hypothetical protein L3Y34_019325 [Caenorhabditis briggsae]
MKNRNAKLQKIFLETTGKNNSLRGVVAHQKVMLEAKDEEINNLKASCKSAEESDARAKQELQLRVEKVTDLTEKLTETEAARDDLQRKMDAINSAKTAFDLAMSQVNADGTSSPSKGRKRQNVGTKKTAPVSYTSFEPKQGSWKFICLIEVC